MSADEPDFDQPSADGPASETERLRAEIADTREELGGTVEALAQKADVKAQAGEKLEEKKREAKAKFDAAQAKVSEAGAKVTHAPPVQKARQQAWVPAAVAGVLALLVMGFLRRRGG